MYLSRRECLPLFERCHLPIDTRYMAPEMICLLSSFHKQIPPRGTSSRSQNGVTTRYKFPFHACINDCLPVLFRPFRGSKAWCGGFVSRFYTPMFQKLKQLASSHGR